MNLRSLVSASLMGAAIYCAKMIMAPLPNIEPVTLLVMVLAVTAGKTGLLAVGIYVFLEYLTWGLQLWSICYLYLWPGLYGITWLNRKRNSPFFFAALAGLYSLAFGALCAIVYLPVLGLNGAITWWIAGIPFDLIHCLSSYLLVLLLFNPLKKVFTALFKKGKPYA